MNSNGKIYEILEHLPFDLPATRQRLTNLIDREDLSIEELQFIESAESMLHLRIFLKKMIINGEEVLVKTTMP